MQIKHILDPEQIKLVFAILHEYSSIYFNNISYLSINKPLISKTN